jgi:hypothetical protein
MIRTLPCNLKLFFVTLQGHLVLFLIIVTLPHQVITYDLPLLDLKLIGHLVEPFKFDDSKSESIMVYGNERLEVGNKQ